MATKINKITDKTATTLKSIKELVELMKKKLDWIELTANSTSTSIRFVREQQSVMNDKLDQHTKTLKSHTSLLTKHTGILTKHTSILEKHTGQLSALFVDVHHVQESVKALGDEIVENRKTRKEVVKIKERLGLAS